MSSKKSSSDIIVYKNRISSDEKRNEQISLDKEIFKLFFNNSPVYFFIKNENLEIEFLSNSFEKMLNRSVSELIGSHVSDIFPDSLSKKIINDDLKVFESMKCFVDEEDFLDKNYSVIKFPVKTENGKKYLCGLAIDITKNKLIETAKNNAEHILIHDLKNAIYGMSTLAENLINNDNPKIVNDNYFDMLKCRIRLVESIINSYTYMLQIEMGFYNEPSKKIDLIELLNIIINSHKNTIGIKKITLRFIYFLYNEKLYVYGNYILVQSILCNLLKNSFEASPEKSQSGPRT